MRYAVRTLLKTPGFTTIAIVTIALGIAANSAIFSVVNGVLLRPLPFSDESRIVAVWTSTSTDPHGNHAAGPFLDLRAYNHTLSGVAGFRTAEASVATATGTPQQFGLVYVTADFFDVLGAPAAVGRTFTGAQAPGGERVVVLSDEAWQKLFARDPAAVGQRVRINGEPSTVIAVMPRAFSWPEGAGVWQLSSEAVPPSPFDLKDPGANRDAHYFSAIARLKPGVTLAAAQQDLHALAATLQRQYPQTDGGHEFRLVPIREELTGDVRGALLTIQGAVGLVLLIACANVSSLLIARASSRRRELAIRAALGAGRGELVRQLLAESLVLGVSGGLAGLLGGSWLLIWLVRLLPHGMPRTGAISLDTTVAAVTVVASLATGVLFGILPAWQASRADAASAMKDTGERGSSARARGRAALVVAEIALTLILLVGAGLLGTTFVRLTRVDPGFRSDHVTIADLALPQPRYSKSQDITRVYRQLVSRLAAQSTFEAVGVGFPGPMRGSNASASFYVEGQDTAAQNDKPYANLGMVSGGYFSAMGIPLVAGRTFTDRDENEAAPPVAIVSEALAKKYWPGVKPVGKRLRFGNDDKEPWFTVVGVTGDVHQLGLKDAAPPLLYVPYPAFALPFTTVAIRSVLPEATVASVVRSQLASVDPSLSLGDVSPLVSVVNDTIQGPKFRAALIGAFALLALILAAVGVYGLISYSVTQRTREIGIRVALGASAVQVIGPVVREGIVLALAGVAVGIAGAALATRALTVFLFGVGAGDPLTFALVASLLVLVGAAASYIPSRRALRVDPVVALRTE